MKTTKIVIKNLFGIKETELDGRSVELSGPKGSGKTSVLDSIRYALTNRSDRDYIVHRGADEGEIIIETDTGLSIDRKQSGEKVTDFVDIVAWRSTAEFVEKYFSKGRMAVVEGRLQIRDWTDKDGNKRRNAEVVADSIYFGDSKRDGDSGGTYHTAGRSSGVNVSASDFTDLGDDDGELPVQYCVAVM